jgi:multiple sugar transport system permease protein
MSQSVALGTFPRTHHSRWQRIMHAIKQNIGGYLFIMPWLFGFCFLTAWPFVRSLYLSFTEWQLLVDPRWIGLNNYTRLFADEYVWKSLYNTLYYVLFHVPGIIIQAFFVALLLNQSVKFRAVFRTCFYLPSITAGVASAIIWVWLLNSEIGVVNQALRVVGIQGPDWLGSTKWAKPALIIMAQWGFGGTMVLYLAGLQGIPDVFYEAAKIDGASAWQRMLNITIPLMTPTIFLTVIMQIIGSFQVFTSAMVMTEGGPANATLFYLLYLYRQAFRYSRMGYASALAWVLFIILLVLTLGQFQLSRRWVYYEGEKPA